MSSERYMSSSRLPYLLGSPAIRQFDSEEDRQDKKDWLIRREELRKAFAPESADMYYRDRFPVNIRNGDKLCLWTSHSSLDTPLDVVEGEPLPVLPYVLMLHGGGYSGLTWAPMVNEISWLIEADYGALDLRGHGQSDCHDETDLSLEVLTQDVLDAIQWMQGEPIKLRNRKLILVGHSMGGALAVNVAVKLQENINVDLGGVVVLDVVEGSALQALTSMQYFLRSRPQEFKSLSEAVQWCVRSGQTKNLDSARISIAGQLKLSTAGQSVPQFVNPNAPIAESECDNDSTSTANESRTNMESYMWRIDLSKTEPYWRGWFEGLSAKFLSVRCPKLLMLAGVDRLDRELTVGQMQGKFQMQVFHQVGHALHEDAPDKVADCIASFLHRQQLVKTKYAQIPSFPRC